MSRQEFIDRYGVALGVLVALVLVVVLLPGNVDDRSVETGFGSGDFDVDSGADPFAAGSTGTVDTGGGTTGGGATTGGTVGGSGGTSAGTRGGTGAGATGGTTGGGSGGSGTGGTGGGGTATPGGGPAVQFGTGPSCRADGRQVGISTYMPPCVQWSGGDNGGATFRGVSADEIRVVKYRAQLDPGTEAILAGANLGDEKGVVDRAMRSLLRYWNLHAETYGREVTFVNVDASGPSESDEAMRADAVRIANDIKPFAVIDADPAAPIPLILAQELAQRGILCFCTAQSTPYASSTYTELPPTIFMEYPTSDEYAAHAAEYIAKKMEGRPAEFAGDDQTVGQTFRSTPRKYGLLYLEGERGKVEPARARNRDAFRRELGKVGIGPDRLVEIGYIYDPGRNQADLTNIVARFKGEGVTTIIPIWDPLTPILLTQEATRQQYYPEWFMLGIGLSDTTTGGRLYDQAQWRNAFGISPLWVTWENVEASPGYREFHHGCPECSPGDEGVLVNIYRERIETMFLGIHMAGPNLTNDTFVRGMYDYPPTGGQAGAPLQFYTRQFPGEVKDFSEVWYDVDRSGPDERGEVGSGVVLRAQGGRRYQLGQWTGDTFAFVDAGTVHVSDSPAGADPAHEQDGHTHPADQRCLSCG